MLNCITQRTTVLWHVSVATACLSLAGCNASTPTESDVAAILGENVQNLRCERADDSKGGFMCSFMTASTGIFGGGARFVKESGSWRAYRN